MTLTDLGKLGLWTWKEYCSYRCMTDTRPVPPHLKRIEDFNRHYYPTIAEALT